VLTIEPPFYQVRGATVFRDHADPDQFYVLPAPPVLVSEGGKPGFTMYKYRRDLTDNPAMDPTKARGGGLAFFDVQAPAPPLAALQAEVAALSGRSDATVSAVLFRSGTVRAIIAHADGDRLIEDLVQTTTAPPVAPHRATFALAMSPEGATLIEQAALGGSLPVGVAYELRFLALTPALQARVSMDYDRMYDHFSTSVGFTYYVQAKFDLDLAWLVEHDLVKIEIIAFTDQEDQQRQQRMVLDLVAARIQGDFFRTGIPPAPQPGAGDALGAMLGRMLGGGTAVTSASALFVLKAKVEVVRERKEFELRYDGRTAIELTHVSTGLLATMVAGGPAPLIEEIDLDDPFFATLAVDVLANVDFGELSDLTGVVAHLRKGEHRSSFEFGKGTPDRAHFEVPLTDPRADDYEVSYEFHFDTDRGGGQPVLTAGPLTTRDRVLVINPFAHVDYHRVRFVLGPVDPALVPRIHATVRLVAPDGGTELGRGTVTLDAAQPERTWRHHLPRGTGARLLVGTEWEDPQGVRHAGQRAELPAGTASFVALGPFQDVLSITVLPAVDWAGGVSHALVELAYADGDYVADRTLTFLAAGGAAPQTVDIPLMDPTRRQYRWRQVVFKPSGPAATEWADSDKRTLVFGAEPATTAEVKLVWVGDPAGAFGLRVDFRVSAAGGERTVGAFLRAGTDLDKAVTVPLDQAGRLRYRYEVRRVAPDGEHLVRSSEGDSDLLVVQATTA